MNFYICNFNYSRCSITYIFSRITNLNLEPIYKRNKYNVLELNMDIIDSGEFHKKTVFVWQNKVLTFLLYLLNQTFVSVFFSEIP